MDYNEQIGRLVFLSRYEKNREYNDINVGEELENAANTIVDLLARAAEAETKLERYRAAEKKLELVFLPIPIGDPVFVVSYEYSGVFGKYYSISEKPFGTDMLPNVGKTVFRTLDDAVQAMDKLYKVLNGGK